MLDRHGWRAGDRPLGLYACKSEDGTAIIFNEGACVENARRYAETEAIVALLGPLQTLCAMSQVPILAEAPGGGLAAVSATNRTACLTRRMPGACDPGEAVGKRTFFQVTVHDLVQAAALAELAEAEGVARAFVVSEPNRYARALGRAFARAARFLGITVVGAGSWSAGPGKALERSAGRLVRRARAARADGLVFVSLDRDGGVVVQRKLQELGPHDGAVKLLASDGLAHSWVVGEGETIFAGVLALRLGPSVDRLPARGRELVAALRARAGPDTDETLLLLAAYTAQAAEMLVDAIARSDGTRAGALEALGDARVRDGPIGDLAFDEYGDPILRWVTAYRVEDGRFVPYRAIDPDARLVDAAAGD